MSLLAFIFTKPKKEVKNASAVLCQRIAVKKSVNSRFFAFLKESSQRTFIFALTFLSEKGKPKNSPFAVTFLKKGNPKTFVFAGVFSENPT